MDADTGKLLWQHQASSAIHSAGIAVGKGSTFRIRLPASTSGPLRASPARQGAPKASAPSLPTTDKPPSPARLLVMDDNLQIRAVIKRAFHGRNFVVALSEEGEEAVGLYRQAMEMGEPFDVVILDLVIVGGMGGAEALQALRAIDPGVRAIAISGYSDEPILAKPREHGFFSGLAKPFALESLQALVAEALSAPPSR